MDWIPVPASPVDTAGFGRYADTDAKMTPDRLEHLKATGTVRGVGRYVGRSDTPNPRDLDAAEVELIGHHGFDLFVIQHCPAADWPASAQLGCRQGLNAVKHAKAVGYSEGASIVFDLEGTRSTGIVVLDHVNEWSRRVQEAGYVPALYVGPQCGLSGLQLYHRLILRSYWRSAANVPDIPVRGYQGRQHLPISIGDFEVDLSEFAADRLGSEFMVARPHNG